MPGGDSSDESQNCDDIEGLFPDYEPILQEFERMVVWKELDGKRVPEPTRGIFEDFDNLNDRVEQIKEQMQDYVEDVAKDTGCCGNVALFQSQSKIRFQLEFPENFSLEDKEEFIQTSTMKGKKRYITQALEDLTEKLEEAEDEL